MKTHQCGHYEACTHLHRSLQRIKNLGMKAGVALNPHTPVHLLSDIIQDADFVLLMSVNPGFGGQSFIENTISKVETLKDLILQKSPNCLIEVDGGVNQENARQLVKVGANILVAGNTVFSAQNPKEAIKQLKDLTV